MKLHSFVFAVLLCAPLAAGAQHDAPAGGAGAAAAPGAAAQFDFMLGQWELEVHPKVSGLAAMIHGAPTLAGTWKAWRVLDGLGIEDEMRIVDASGNPISLSRALRVYARGEDHWKVSGVDAQRGRLSAASGQLTNGEMRMEGSSTDAEGKPTLTRTRYYGITADSFHMQQDRSTDNGQSWEEGALIIDAKRVAASATP